MQGSINSISIQEQYMFIHDAILEFLTCGDTQIAAANLRMEMNKLTYEDPTHKCTGYQHQFNVLGQVSPSPTEVNCSVALRNPKKNRGDKYLPGVLSFKSVILSSSLSDKETQAKFSKLLIQHIYV